MFLPSAVLYLVCLLAFESASGARSPTDTNDVVNLGSDQIAKLRGFQAENLYVTSKDGYIINVVHIFPVKKTTKRPVVFNHGSTQSSTYFLTNSVGAKPRDLSGLDVNSMTKAELIRMFGEDPIAKSLPLLLSCLGHDVYMINRRGTDFSLGKVGSPSAGLENVTKRATSGTGNALNSLLGGRAGENPESSENLLSGLESFLQLLLKPQLDLASIPITFDPKYWNFSLDEQAKYDLVALLNYILEKTGSKQVAYVGHSLGNGLMFMLQSEQPEWANKVAPFLAWSPDFYLGHTTSILRPLLVALQPILTTLSIPFPPTPINPLTRTLLAALCQTRLAQNSICRLIEEAQWGFSEGQQETLPAFMASQFYSISSHEAAQLAQNSEFGKMHKFNYATAAQNIEAYGQPVAPIYDVGRITSKDISLWHGERDALATPTDTKLLIEDLRVEVDDRFITEVPFNHYDLMFGKNVSQLVNIPSMQLIESYD